MTPRILLTTTSFQDTPGPHHAALAATGWEIVTARGPLSEADTLALVGEIDGYLCGDDAITRQVIEKATPRLKVLSKYGIGVDKIDVAACTAKGIPLLFTPGVNHTTVAEHCFLLMLALEKNLLFHTDSTRTPPPTACRAAQYVNRTAVSRLRGSCAEHNRTTGTVKPSIGCCQCHGPRPRASA